MQAIERTIEAATHGRYLIASPEEPFPGIAIVSFHGYGENAEMQMERLRPIAERLRCLLISIQGLHRFYRGSSNEVVVASWMTRQNRQLAIADNISYVGRVVESVLAERRINAPLLFAGFSQGVSMAFRAAVSSTVQPVAAVAVGGDLPPEIQPGMLKRLLGAMLCHGVSDPFYSHEKFRDDEARLTRAGVKTRLLEFNGGHVWPGDLDELLPSFIRDCFPDAIVD
jgi:predicted esterase